MRSIMLTDEQGASKAHRLIWGALAIGAAYVAYSVMTLIITTLEPTTLLYAFCVTSGAENVISDRT